MTKEPPAKLSLSAKDLLSLLLGGGAIFSLITVYANAKTKQQEQLDKFITSSVALVKAMKPRPIKSPEQSRFNARISLAETKPLRNLAVSTKAKPELITAVPVLPESAISRAYVLTTLQAFDGDLPFTRDNRKKETLLSILYEFGIIGNCKPENNPVLCSGRNISLKGANLNEIDFRKVSLGLPGINLSGTQILGADFTGVNLRSAVFSGTSASNAIFNRTDFRDANLEAADLKDASFRGALLEGASFKDSYLCGADLSTIIPSQAGQEFLGAYISEKTRLSQQLDSTKRRLFIKIPHSDCDAKKL